MWAGPQTGPGSPCEIRRAVTGPGGVRGGGGGQGDSMVYLLVSPTLAAESGRGRRQSHGGHGVSGGTRLRLHRKLQTASHVHAHARTYARGLQLCTCACSQRRGHACGGVLGLTEASVHSLCAGRATSPAVLSCKLLSCSHLPWAGGLGRLLGQSGCGQTFVLSLGRGERKSPDAVYVTKFSRTR